MLTRQHIYTLLIIVSAGLMLGRIIAVNRTDTLLYQQYRFGEVNKRFNELEKELREANASEEELAEHATTRQQRLENERRELPIFSANDRSRWNTLRVLVEPDLRVQRTVTDGTEKTETVWYAIDKAQNVRGWDTIDMVKHNNVAELAEQSFLTACQKEWTNLLASIGSIVRRDRAEKEEPLPIQSEGYLYSSKPPLLPTLMAVPYAIMYRATDGKLSLEHEPFLVVRVMLVVCNLLPLVFCWFLLSRLIDRFGGTDWGRVFAMIFVCFGTFLSTFVVTLNNHLPGVVCVTIAFYCAVRIVYDQETRWRYFIGAGFFSAFAVACEIPALLFCAFVGLWLLCHQWKRTLSGFVPAALVVMAAFFATNYVAHKTILPAYSNQAWYFYEYERNGRTIQSYWQHPAGFDKGEPSRGNYIFHATIGHHGLFSLTPVWALSVIGLGCWLTHRRYWSMATLILLMSVVVFLFYTLVLPEQQRNYGGNTSALRWMFWLAPLWSVALVAAADWCSRKGFLRAIALACLAVSVMSVAYPVWNPWTVPWSYNLLEYLR